MYSVDLAQITLDEFQQILTTIDLLPGRRILLTNLSAVIGAFKGMAINDLAALQKVLRNKNCYSKLASDFSVSIDYITVLNREINSYVSKPIALSKLDVFSEAELNQLDQEGLKSTKDLYDYCLTKSARRTLSERLQLPEGQIVKALEVIDLLRIQGVGLVYAAILREIGIRSPADYLQMNSEEILHNYQNINDEKAYTKAKLGIKDIEYCKRFCQKLDADIEW